MTSRFLTPFSSGGMMGRDPFAELHRDINRLFDSTFRGMSGDGIGTQISAPRMDVHETEQGFELTAELPGVMQNDIDLRIEGDTLTIRGEKRNQRQDKQAHLVERSFGSFQRSVQLPFAPNPDQVQAHFQDGLLTISLPKTGAQEKSRRIEVRHSGSNSALHTQANAGQMNNPVNSGLGNNNAANSAANPAAGNMGTPAMNAGQNVASMPNNAQMGGNPNAGQQGNRLNPGNQNQGLQAAAAQPDRPKGTQ